MGQLPIVNQSTVRNLINEGHVGTTGSLKKRWKKTLADLFSDALGTRGGQAVFPWIVKGEGGGNLGFKYEFTIGGPPKLVPGNPYPIKIPLTEKGDEYEYSLRESEALTLWNKQLLWNAIGKKSLGRGRSITPQTPWEDDQLRSMLSAKNPSGPRRIQMEPREYTDSFEVTIDTSVDRDGVDFDSDTPPDERLRRVTPRQVRWRKDGQFVVEKALEAWLMENFDSAECEGLRRLVFPADSEVEWFSNYLPFGVQGGNIDLVVVSKSPEGRQATVIELKRGDLTESRYEEAAHQAIDYAQFIRRALAAFDVSASVRPVVLSGKSHIKRSNPGVVEAGMRSEWIRYEIDSGGGVNFELN